MSFDGANDYVSAGVVSEMTSARSFTVSTWFWRTVDNAANATNHGVHNVLLAQSSDTSNDNFELGTLGGNVEVYFDTPDQDGPSPSIREPASIANNQWHHLALTYDADRPLETSICSWTANWCRNTPLGAAVRWIPVPPRRW